MINPILMAAARGARLELRYSRRSPWHAIDAVNLSDCEPSEYLRIHPDDLHLMYGTISSALREAAENPPDEYPRLALEVTCVTGLDWDWNYQYNKCRSKKHRSTFLLMLAEELMWEGL